MTKELLEVEVMDAEHLKRILDAHKTGPQLVPGTSAQAGAGEVASDAINASHRDVAEGSA